MKNLLTIIPVMLVVFALTCCSSPNSDEKGEVDQSANPTQNETTQKTIKINDLLSQNKARIKEDLYFKLRSLVDIGENSFVKYENLEINQDRFDYMVFVVDESLLKPLAMRNNQMKVILARDQKTLSNAQVGDSIHIEGTISVESEIYKNETLPNEVVINIEGKYMTSFMYISIYSKYERSRRTEQIEQSFIVNLTEPHIYPSNQMYLKMRIFELQKDDLKGMAKPDLVYLRNEIFARHGHRFKTEKMQEYFRNKSWYKPYIEDATPYLNEFEKRNAQFIKSLEG